MAATARFNKYILNAIDMIDRTRSHRGYDINSYFTQDLDYGGTGKIPANHPPKTMCVAAVVEMIIEALNLWKKDQQDPQQAMRPFTELPLKSWKGGSRADIRAHIFMYDGLHCRGTAHALSRFGIGAEASFDQLQAGDVVNFNRSVTGHAAIFLAYLDAHYNEIPYGPNVAGFKYYSAQGMNRPDGGFGYRWGFFAGTCPPEPAGKVRDCGIRRSSSLSVLDVGYMFDPADWNVPSATASLRADYVAQVRHMQNWDVTQFSDKVLADAAVQDLADKLFNAELLEPDLSRFDDSREPPSP